MFGREPVAWMNAIRLSILAAVSFGLTLTDVQLVSLMAAIEALMTVITRSQVVPNKTIEEKLSTTQANKVLDSDTSK